MKMRRLRRSPVLFLLVGLLIGIGAMQWNRPSAENDWIARCLAERPVSATATHGQDNFAIATGEVDDGVEALYFLDFLTGELKAAVLNPRSQKFTALYVYKNVMKDLGIEQVKNPRFLMVTGTTDMRRMGTTPALRLGKGVVYITELTSARIAAYAVPWNPTAFATATVQTGELRPMDVVTARTVAIRPN